MAEVTPTPDERSAILEQLDRMLQHQAFRNSKRCKALLRYLVEQAMENPAAHFKERTLGIEVFGRDASYDTALDPIVRTTASEIRKRIGQYYHEGNHENELRIELLAGSYLPNFKFNPLPPVLAVHPETNSKSQPVEIPSFLSGRSTRSFRWHSKLLYGVIGAIVALVVVGATVKYLTMPSNASRFWAPLISPSTRVLISVGAAYPPGVMRSNAAGNDAKSQTANTIQQLPNPELPMNDVNSISKIVGVLAKAKKTYEMRDAESSTLADLREGPVILIGAFDNSWTLRLSSPLRFHFEEDSKSKILRIRDSYHSTREDWMVGKDQDYKDLKKDYALVSRYSDETTGTTVLEVAGLRSYGTNVAAEFVSNPTYLNAMGKSISNCKRNIQIVLQADIIDGISSPPQVLAVHCW